MNEQSIIAEYIVEALEAGGGSAKLIEVAKHIWNAHAADLEKHGDLFYRWQYVMRWSANKLAKDGRIAFDAKQKGLWHLLQV